MSINLLFSAKKVPAALDLGNNEAGVVQHLRPYIAETKDAIHSSPYIERVHGGHPENCLAYEGINV